MLFAKSYPEYLAPKAIKAIHASQGSLVALVQTFEDTDQTTLTQGFVIDAKEGLILSVAHGLSDYPAVAYSKSTKYIFAIDGANYSLELKIASKTADLAIFKINTLGSRKLKAISYAKKLKLFEEYYSINEKVEVESDVVKVIQSIPWKASLVNINKEDELESLTFDKSVIYGFSGSGVFNKNGELIGITTSSLLPGGFSRAVSLNTIQEFIKAYRAIEKIVE